ncbi:MAG: proteasome accessory factor PafA2 family protein [Armatimonadetes bacterium]|nr:proteasome accessory factor PafA2 family protein [Armatimonadota bacterium]
MPLFGIETEYGLAIEGSSPHSQLADAAALIAQFDGPSFAGWDYAHETPRADLRGFEADQLATDPADAQWDSGEPQARWVADRVLTNGARLYNDHGHPEYATPECDRVLDLVTHDRAGELIVRRMADALQAAIGRGVSVYKNNTDFHGASYGTHENYLVPRSIEFSKLAHGLLPLFICRQLLVGAGKVGSEVGRPARYQLSQRADFLSELASVDTLYRRPIFNTRDEPHADADKWMRLHVICGDANRIEWSTAMKVAMTQIAIRLIEIGEEPTWRVCSPVKAFESVSKDEGLEWRIELDNGSCTTAAEVLDSYLSSAERHLVGNGAETDWVLAQWRLALSDLSNDPLALKDRCDWAAKLALLNQFAEAEGGWKPSTMQSLDLQYHNIDTDESLFDALKQLGHVQSLVPEARVQDAVTIPPNTRARLRGNLVAASSAQLKTIGWRRAVLEENGDLRIIEFPVQ